jgi:putative tricarboxylic transport membrane protein
VTRASRLIISAVLAGLAAAVMVLAQGISIRHVPGDPGPRAFPVAAAALVVAGAGAALILDLRRAGAEAGEPVGTSLLVVLATAAYLALMPLAGFAVSTALLLAGVSLRLDRDRRSPLIAHALVAVATAGAAWLIFTRLLDVMLPAGPWGF